MNIDINVQKTRDQEFIPRVKVFSSFVVLKVHTTEFATPEGVSIFFSDTDELQTFLNRAKTALDNPEVA